MKKATIVILMVITIMAIYKDLTTPEWVWVNAQEAQRCTTDMQTDMTIICD